MYNRLTNERNKMYNPYRTNSCLKNKKELTYKRNFFIKIIRRWFLSLLIFFAGTYKKRYPIKCPCGLRSWDPQKMRREAGYVKDYRLLNSYKCGKMHDLRNIYIYS